ncbi:MULTISPECIES: vWA domain-containing protein [unclassified Halomonas]|uniref:vWA domain-containing protein n=1 Tax=unclassified Halomonas TaxID=2609666 RepID=UPI001C98D928|nr:MULTISPECIES: VWA domain-containing protein [unclassified Halomonas]MBY5925704.1 VWA domain-containing protein [Halomonas sp. DP4Y7-2]MBY6232477.1 VWA domain-containing protein [Halomonas sp. DP4Y7-1]
MNRSSTHRPLHRRPSVAAAASLAALSLGLYLLWPQGQDVDVVTGSEPSQDAGMVVAPPRTASKSEAALESTERGRLASSPSASLSPATSTSTSTSTSTAMRGLMPSQEVARIAPVPSPGPSARVSTVTTEAYPEFDASSLRVTAEAPVSTFSVDVDTASYAVVRSSLMQGQLPPPQAVRIEEMINYFSYDYPQPDAEAFLPIVDVFASPWNSGRQLVRVALQGRAATPGPRPPVNLVLLIDTSGSMHSPDKLPLLKRSMALLLGELEDDDEIAIVTYAGSAGIALKPTRVAQRDDIISALERLTSGGGTAGEAGLRQAYRVARRMSGEGETTRVVLATDGDFNLGISDPEALERFIADQRDDGAYLSVLGFGRGNLDDAVMQSLAQHGNGQAAYIDSLAEAQKVLVDQLSASLEPIANDVKVRVEFNPARVQEYRLIGYETRGLRPEDFRNDRVDAGDIGAGHQVTALYEVTPVGSHAAMSEPRRYAKEDHSPAGPYSDELGHLALRYKVPGGDRSRLIEMPIKAPTGAAWQLPDSEASFAAAIAGFGQLLSDDRYLGDWGWDDAIALAEGNRGEDRFGYRAEAVRLMRLARDLSER